MEQVKIGVLGLGTVGSGTLNILKNNAAEISRRTGKSIVVTHAAVRDMSVERDCDLDQITIYDDVMQVVNEPSIDMIVELIGGTNLAFDAIKQAIENKKHIITANKALIAIHGNALSKLANANQVSIHFEAAVAGGIPIIKSIREGLSANHIEWLAGIINGTNNFILSEMHEKGRNFTDVLAEAQRLGYAEADPTFDIEGIDAAHKLTILASIAFGMPLRFDRVFNEGIALIKTNDINYADELGFRIKHLGIARKTDMGVEMRVHPALIPKENLLANVNGVMNAVMVKSDAVGVTMHFGAGAGSMPTASAVVADIIDAVRTVGVSDIQKVPTLAFQFEAIKDVSVLSMDEVHAAYYIRAKVDDRTGVIADISAILANYSISIDKLIQKEHPSDTATVVFLTHVVKENNINQAIAKIESLDSVQTQLIKIRAESLT